MTTIDIDCRPEVTGWTCSVRLGQPGATLSQHVVTVARADLDRLAPGSTDPIELVRRSFEFLLEREAPASILRSFDLVVIGRYFPEYEATISG